MKKWLIPLVLFIAVVYIIFEFVNTSQKAEPIEEERTMQATDFSLPTLTGEERFLSSEKGKVVIINFGHLGVNCVISKHHIFNLFMKNIKEMWRF